MGSKEIIDAFKNKAVRFLQEAERDVGSGWYDFALFHAEQALQLALKALLLEREGRYPFTHDLDELIISMASTHFPELRELKTSYVSEIQLLITAYTASRCTPQSYNRDVAIHIIGVVKEFFKVIGILTE